MSADISFRALSENDLKAMYAIETQAHAYPWRYTQLSDCFGRLYHNIGCWHGATLVGYCVVRAVLDEAELLNIAIVPTYQGQGIGRALLVHLLEYASNAQWQLLGLEVRLSNIRAQRLYLSQGFSEVDCRRGYYPSEHGREDALIMLLQL